MTESTWQYSTIHKSPCKIVEEQTLWGQAVCRVWLPNQDAVVRVPRASLQPLANRSSLSAVDHISYIAAAAKIAEVLDGYTEASDGHVLLAPMESNVIPLPHQINALSRAIAGDKIRYLLADEVGLGKTIEAGLILRELKLRGLVRRILIVVPKGLAAQWVSEMRVHLNEEFQLILGQDVEVLRRMSGTEDPTQRNTYLAAQNPFLNFNQIIVPMDTYKPSDGKYGEAARSRFEDLITAGWDLVVVDEAHRLGGNTDQVARYKLGQGLAEAAPYLLLLSATPHQGKTDAFHRLMTLLDDDAFPDMESVSRERVAPYVIRTEKRNAIDEKGNTLFKPRRTRMIPVQWQPRHHLQQLLYEAVTDYVREGYNQALRENKRYIGFLMVLMQRLVISSTCAIRTTLERRLNVLKGGAQSATLQLAEMGNSPAGAENFDEFYDMDGQELLDALLESRIAAIQNEVSHVETLLTAARECEQTGPDAKAEALIDWIYRLQVDENEPELKVLIFTEFVSTQEMLKEFLKDRGIQSITLNGAMNLAERKSAQDAFRDHVRVLISTDAGGEGINLQFCHVVINFDIPWNPMRLEQRIGRVDRIGQSKVVQAVNFVFEDSVEFRVREVLEEKLAVIFDEFGIDKTGDVLDSAQAGELFEDVFTSAILDPENIEVTVDQAVTRIHEEIRQTRATSTIYGISDTPDIQMAERLRTHPLPHWTEKMTTGYLNSHGGSAIKKRSWWDLTWPDGQTQRKCVFSVRETDRLTGAELVNLENSKVRGLAMNLPQVIAGQPLPCVWISELPSTINGFWGLYEVRLQTGMIRKTRSLGIPAIRRGYLCVFVSKEGKLFLPTARHIWDALQTQEIRIQDAIEQDDAITAHTVLQDAAEQSGQEIYNTLKQAHFNSIAQEEERGVVAFVARRKAIKRVGLPEVRRYRMARCDEEETQWRKDLESAQQVLPEIRALLLLHIIKDVA